ncbi:hypothetical protein [Corallococcus terminator]|uniref:hypothetical protein n=1 Tax=Corallococcus terminator TaxID=2316733 RepID=UPI0011C42CF4|nr:hypothetical protein [Corallococcus terminator]
MNLFRGLALLTGGLAVLSGCATLDTSNLSPSCRSQYNACLDSCQPSSRVALRIPQDSVQGQSVGRTPDTQTPGCVDECNQQAKTCS